MSNPGQRVADQMRKLTAIKAQANKLTGAINRAERELLELGRLMRDYEKTVTIEPTAIEESHIAKVLESFEAAANKDRRPCPYCVAGQTPLAAGGNARCFACGGSGLCSP